MVRNKHDPASVQTVVYLGDGDHAGVSEHESAAMDVNDCDYVKLGPRDDWMGLIGPTDGIFLG
jgi:hypothetical protein